MIEFFWYQFQIWAGNEACEPVTWRECKLVPRQVDFKVPKVECTDGEEIPYTELVDVEKIQMTTKMSCEVRAKIPRVDRAIFIDDRNERER